MKVTLIAGARPNFMKIAPIIDAKASIIWFLAQLSMYPPYNYGFKTLTYESIEVILKGVAQQNLVCLYRYTRNGTWT